LHHTCLPRTGLLCRIEIYLSPSIECSRQSDPVFRHPSRHDCTLCHTCSHTADLSSLGQQVYRKAPLVKLANGRCSESLAHHTASPHTSGCRSACHGRNRVHLGVRTPAHSQGRSAPHPVTWRKYRYLGCRVAVAEHLRPRTLSRCTSWVTKSRRCRSVHKAGRSLERLAVRSQSLCRTLERNCLRSAARLRGPSVGSCRLIRR
jgi:hypothetical protein